jgi:hypothetical protein
MLHAALSQQPAGQRGAASPARGASSRFAALRPASAGPAAPRACARHGGCHGRRSARLATMHVSRRCMRRRGEPRGSRRADRRRVREPARGGARRSRDAPRRPRDPGAVHARGAAGGEPRRARMGGAAAGGRDRPARLPHGRRHADAAPARRGALPARRRRARARRHDGRGTRPKPGRGAARVRLVPQILVPEPNTWRELLATLDARFPGGRPRGCGPGVRRPQPRPARRARGARRARAARPALRLGAAARHGAAPRGGALRGRRRGGRARVHQRQSGDERPARRAARRASSPTSGAR